jgi:DNA-binding XRE family transcriptional regulator
MRTDVFAARLRRWRGDLRQKEAAAIIGVHLRTYQFWEAGIHAPAKEACVKCIEAIMREYDQRRKP